MNSIQIFVMSALFGLSNINAAEVAATKRQSLPKKEDYLNIFDVKKSVNQETSKLIKNMVNKLSEKNPEVIPASIKSLTHLSNTITITRRARMKLLKTTQAAVRILHEEKLSVPQELTALQNQTLNLLLIHDIFLLKILAIRDAMQQKVVQCP